MYQLHWRRSLLIIPFVLLTSLHPIESRAESSVGCFDVRVEYRGREYVRTVDNVQYFRWSYRVYGQGCINRGLSHWVVQLCTGVQRQLKNVSIQSLDTSDPPKGPATTYMYETGRDPGTGVDGLKWNYITGNQIDKPGEYDDFSFVASGTVTTVNWAAKAGTINVRGTTLGPSCQPVPVRNMTWGSIKTLYRD